MPTLAPMASSAAPVTSHRPTLVNSVGFGVFALCVCAMIVSPADCASVLRTLGITCMPETFADVRTFSGAHVALERGLDPMLENPGDPWQRPLNYPRIWQLPAHLGLREEHTEAVASLFALALLFGIWRLRRLADSTTAALLLLLALFAPTTWLAIERGNSDMLVFALVAAAVTVAATDDRRPARTRAATTVATTGASRLRAQTGPLLVTLAGVLKLFPIAALAAFVDVRANRTVRRLLPALVLFGVYLSGTAADLGEIHRGTLSAHWVSYGMRSLPAWLAEQAHVPSQWLYGVAAIALAVVVWLAVRTRRRIHLDAAGTPRALQAFRAGAAVYLLTFVAGESFDYRLVFLVLVLPQLASWAHTTSFRLRRAALLLAATVLVLLWSQTWRALLANVLGSTDVGIALDEWLSWFLWCGLAGFTTLSLPDWLVPGLRRDADRPRAVVPYRVPATTATDAPSRETA